MKRRRVLQSLVALPAATALPAQQPPVSPPPKPTEETPKLTLQSADGLGVPAHRFFTPDQFGALKRLSELIMPAAGELPGAVDAGVPEFLDFLISESPADRQKLYRQGLDRLNAGKPLASATEAEAATKLAALRQPWSYKAPADPLARFLLAAKEDIIQATINSREYVTAASQRSRGAGGTGAYWYPVE